MGSFSIWHWIVLFIITSPVILGFAIMGPQRKIILKHGQSGLTKSGYTGYSWTYLIFGWLVPVVRGEIGIGVADDMMLLVDGTVVVEIGMVEFVVEVEVEDYYE